MARYHRSIVAFGVALVPLCFTRSAFASDWYVDALAGNDMADGTSPATAWRTITHALATLSSGSGPDTVHVATGVYSGLSGEVFPLVLRDQEQVVGDAGADSTFVVAHGVGPTGFSIAADSEHSTAGVGSATALSGLSIQGFGVGIDVVARTSACDPRLHDLVLHACGVGIRVAIQPSSGAAAPTASPALVRERFTNNGTGLLVTSAASFAVSSAGRVTVEDSLFSQNYNGAVLDGFGRSPQIDIQRSRFLTQAAFGVRASGSIPLIETGTTVDLRDCLFARNVEGGAFLDAPFVDTARITGCTFADSQVFGMRVLAADSRIANTIAWGSHPDAELGIDADVSHCDIGVPTFSGVQGSIDADPLFMDAAHGDYRLRFGSPCVDRADDTASGLFDLTGSTRRIDGDLNTLAAPDMGAFELRPLDLVGEPTIGHAIGLAFLGPEGATSTLFVAHAPLVQPSPTPFGPSWLPAQGTVQAAVVHVHAGPPYVLRRRIPDDPALVGTTFSFQALTNSAAAPAGLALTNPVTFVIQP